MSLYTSIVDGGYGVTGIHFFLIKDMVKNNKTAFIAETVSARI